MQAVDLKVGLDIEESREKRGYMYVLRSTCT